MSVAPTTWRNLCLHKQHGRHTQCSKPDVAVQAANVWADKLLCLLVCFLLILVLNVDLHHDLRFPLALVKLQAQFVVLLLPRYRSRKPDDMFITWGALNLVPSLSSFKTLPQTHAAFYVGQFWAWTKPLKCVAVMWAHFLHTGLKFVYFSPCKLLRWRILTYQKWTANSDKWTNTAKKYQTNCDLPQRTCLELKMLCCNLLMLHEAAQIIIFSFFMGLGFVLINQGCFVVKNCRFSNLLQHRSVFQPRLTGNVCEHSPACKNKLKIPISF